MGKTPWLRPPGTSTNTSAPCTERTLPFLRPPSPGWAACFSWASRSFSETPPSAAANSPSICASRSLRLGFEAKRRSSSREGTGRARRPRRRPPRPRSPRPPPRPPPGRPPRPKRLSGCCCCCDGWGGAAGGAFACSAAGAAGGGSVSGLSVSLMVHSRGAGVQTCRKTKRQVREPSPHSLHYVTKPCSFLLIFEIEDGDAFEGLCVFFDKLAVQLVVDVLLQTLVVFEQHEQADVVVGGGELGRRFFRRAAGPQSLHRRDLRQHRV